MEYKIYTAQGELYVREPELENSIDVVIQHMNAAGFSYEEIKQRLNVPMELIISACTPSI